MKKTILKKLAAVTLCLTVAVAFTACGGSDKKSEEKDSSSKKEVTYVVGTEPTFPPFDTTDEDGNLDGFDMDIMKAIAKDQGYKVKFKSMEFSALIPALDAGNLDIVAAGMNCQDKTRREKADFTKTYYDSGLVVMVKEDNKDIKGEQDLTKDMKVASQTGTTGDNEINKLKDEGKIKEAISLNGFDQCITQLKTGNVNAVIIDKPVAENYMAKHEGEFKAVGKVIGAESFGFAVKKGNKEVKKKLDEGLDNIIESGEFKEICEKWNIQSKFDK